MEARAMLLQNTRIGILDVKHQMLINGAANASGSCTDRTDELRQLLTKIGLINAEQEASKDKAAKIGQVFSYLEIMHAQLRNYSRKRDLVLIDSGAGNCFLSYLVYCFYSAIDERRVRIHCVDSNERLMDKNRQLANSLGFEHMHFHACDIADYEHEGQPDAVYSLHACDSATDKTLHLGLRTEARHIFSVSCCQHAMLKDLRRHPYTGITRHMVLRDRLAYMVGDSLRALLLEMQGYRVNIIEFASSRYTDKNVMLRAKKGQTEDRDRLYDQYRLLRSAFQLSPALERYLCQEEGQLNVQA
jgi:methyltransferase family protein